MKLVVGLGNPGARYVATRHNVGFRIAERFAFGHGIPLEDRRFDGRFGRGVLVDAAGEAVEVGVLEPETFMNRSGDSVAQALRELPVEDPARDLLVALDDADLPFGRLRLRPSGGAAGHRGLEDVLERLGHRDVPRLRFGVGRPPEGIETAAYVLEPYSPHEERELPGRVAAAAEAVAAALTDGLAAAMNRYNPAPADG